MAQADRPPVQPSPLGALQRAWSNPQARYPLLVLLYLSVIALAFNAAFARLAGPIEAFSGVTAGFVHGLIALFTDATTHRGSLVSLDGFAVEVIPECIGVLEMLIYSACVLAFPSSLRARAAGIGFGCLAIFGFNLLRIATLLVVGRHWNEAFEFFHVYFWQGTLIAMIVGVLYAWIRIFTPR